MKARKRTQPIALFRHAGNNVFDAPIGLIHPSPENDLLYNPIDPNDPAFRELVEQIRVQGVLQPIEVTSDGWIVSGHRRYAAAAAVGLATIPTRCLHVLRTSMSTDEFVRLLREHNRQREKTLAERTREEVVSVDQGDAYEHLREYRRQKSTMVDFQGKIIVLGEVKLRKRITDAKLPLLNAVLKIVGDYKEHWPLSVRRIHYLLLNNPPLKHASKPDSTYENTLEDYHNQCVDILTRGRIAGLIPWEATSDETRPFCNWNAWKEPGAFIHQQFDRLLKGYFRDLMQSQPAHIEIVGEKLTVQSTIERVAMDYCIPVTIGRGYASTPPRHDLYKRFTASGREKLVVLMLNDFDPEGEDIPRSYARSMRDDFGIPEAKIFAVKVALNREHVDRFKLPPKMKAKKTSSRYKSFVEAHGEDCWELDALPPDVLGNELRRAIDGVIDTKAFEHERKMEAADARQLEATRRAALKALPGLVK